MSKMIAVSGPPGSGKTTLTLKLAQEVHEKTKKKVVYLSPDTLIPALGTIFPKRDKLSLLSLGVALENVNLAITDILGVIATTKAMPNMGYLGYIPGDGPYSYVALSEKKVLQMFQLMRDNFDYIFIDCDRERGNLISTIGCGLCDHLIQIINPDIKSIAYYGFEDIPDRAIQVLNLLDNDIYLPIQDTRTHFPNIQFAILYSRMVKMQMFNGELMDLLKDPIYRKAIKPIAELITAEPEEQSNEEQPTEEADPLAIEQDDAFWA